MQVTIDIPELVYRELEIQAERERKTPADVLMERAEAGRSVPVVEPGP
ncbi:MAG: hypothetical protein M3R43_03175 [Acidobacteriota bacterium]|nr:hypothetical protein [Acidobacteriota bacterium]